MIAPSRLAVLRHRLPTIEETDDAITDVLTRLGMAHGPSHRALVADLDELEELRAAHVREQELYYVAVGPLTGDCGDKHDSLGGAYQCVMAHCEERAATGDHSDRHVKACEDGRLRDLTEDEKKALAVIERAWLMAERGRS